MTPGGPAERSISQSFLKVPTSMRLLLAFLFLHGVLGVNFLGKPLLQGTELCRPWTALNNKLFHGAERPNSKEVIVQLKALLPKEDWQAVVEDAVNICYGSTKSRSYTNTCPGQELLHCVVDNLITQCPASALRKNDSCAPLSSLAGFNYMFSQSRYENMKFFLPDEPRPLWFLNNYFSSKCCDVPLFSAEFLSEFGFRKMIHYYDHEHKTKGPHFVKNTPAMIVTTEAHIAEKVRVVDHADKVRDVDDAEKVRVVEQSQPEPDDPLDCCDMSEFISPEARSSCNFQTTWNARKRLEIVDSKVEEIISTTRKPEPSLKHHDVKVVPLSCEKETCIFKTLNIVSDSGLVDTSAFSRLLDNLTSEHPEWLKAKARVVTRCLTKPIKDYQGECEINKVLSCTFDVLSENCPHGKKPTVDPCRHTYSMKNDTICQINSSKFRPKNRRQYCDFPRFVPHEALSSCGVGSVSRVEKAAPPAVATPPRKLGWLLFKPLCNETKQSTNCLLSKMGVLNKYKFLDYFKMKDRIRNFTSGNVGLNDIYMASMNAMPMYRESCASQRKLLNVVDAMLMTCPVTRRKNTDKCNKIFSEMITRAPEKQQAQIKDNIQHDFMIAKTYEVPKFGPPMPQINRNTFKKHESVLDQMLLGADYVPPVRIMHIKPQKMIVKAKETNGIQIKRPLEVTPVYMAQSTTSFPVTTSGYALPEEYLRTGALRTPSFRHDGTFRSVSGHKSTGNGHQGPGNMFGFPNMPMM